MRLTSTFKRSAVLVISCATLAACSGGFGFGSMTDSMTKDMSGMSDPNFFNVNYEGQKMTGRFYPAGYSTAQVQQLISLNCASGRLKSFGAQMAATQMVFSAHCDGDAIMTDGNAEFTNDGIGNVTIETIYPNQPDNLSPKKVVTTI